VERTTPPAPLVEVDPDAARAALGGRRIGPHLALGAGLQRAAARARAIGASAIQVFGDNPTAWRRRDAPRHGLDAFRTALAAADIGPLAVHAPYLVNLATPDDALRARSVEVIVSELLMARHFGAAFLNVHIGSHRGSSVAEGIARVGESLRRVLDAVVGEPDLPLLVLENAAGQGDSVGVTVDELADILAAAEAAGCDPSRLGICLDTAHLWGGGYGLDDPGAIDQLLGELDIAIGPTRLAMLHLNDARPARGSRQDRHEHLGTGRIGCAGMRHLLTHPRLAHVPAYLETPDMESGWDAVNMDRVRRLIAGEPLEGEGLGREVPGAA
jgi:deoxyribonuclease IV